MGLLGGPDVLSPTEQLFWEAYYCIEPYDGETFYLAHVLAAILKAKKPVLPSDCIHNQPLEDTLDQDQSTLVSMMNALVEEQTGKSVQQLTAETGLTRS